MHIVIATRGLAFDGSSLQHGSLGGSETAVICAARELAKLGHVVRVFCECRQPGNHEGVIYSHHKEFSKQCGAMDVDVLIASRWADFLAAKVSAGLRVLWCHDVLTAPDEVMPGLFQTDLIMLLSNYHIQQYTGIVPELRPHIWQTSNGVDMDLVQKSAKPKVPKKLIYTSRPERGLHFLLSEIMPKILERHPDAKLHCATYKNNLIRKDDPAIRLMEQCASLQEQFPSNVVQMGELRKDQLYHHMSSAQLQLYPTEFPEISPVRGDTLVETLTGQFQIKDLVGKSGFYVYSCDAGGNLSYSKVRGVFKTRSNTKMLRLIAAPGRGRNAKKQKELFLTPDHEVMLRDGTYRRADQLKPGDRIKAFHRNKDGWQTGYDMIGVTGKDLVPEHRFVASKAAGRNLRKGEVVDHDNGNTRDNNPENLNICSGHGDHFSRHWKRLNDGEFADRVKGRLQDLRRWEQSLSPQQLSKVKSSAAKKFWDSLTAEEREKFCKSRIVSEDGQARRSDATRRRMDAIFANKPWRNRAVLEHLYVDRQLSTVEIGEILECSDGCVGRWLKNLGVPVRDFSESQICKNRKKEVLSNHTILSIEEADPADAFCMEVEPDHNFVANGIFVHNCITAMEAQACQTPIVTTNSFALKETVGPLSGVLLDGLPSDDDYAQRFADKVCDLLDHPEQIAAMAAEGPKWINDAGFTWEAVAKSWTEKFEGMLAKRWAESKDRVVMELERRNDLVPAKRLAEKEGLQDEVQRITQKIQDAQEFTEKGEIRDRFRKALPRFRTLSQLVTHLGRKPKKVLVWRSSGVSFGIFAAQNLPEAEITIYSQDEEVRNVLQFQAGKSNLKNIRIVDKLAVSESFDLVVADEQVDTAVSPTQALKSLMGWANTGGIVGFTTRFGAKAGNIVDATPERLWNLSQSDYQQMFADESLDFKMAFSSTGLGDGGDLTGHWVVCVRKTVKIAEPDIEGRKRRVRPYKTVGVCMITKNEEEWLLGCLKCVGPIADRIVIADCHSTDYTAAIAEEFGAEVKQIDFDNFAQARNESIKDIGTDWILWVDADERLLGTNSIRAFLQSEICNGFGIRQNHLMLDLDKSFDVPIRLFKNKPQYQFNGYVHEQPEDTSEQRFDKPIAPSLILPDADIAHFGYINEKTRRRKVSSRNLQLLIRDVQENEGRKFTWVFVIRDYMNFAKWYREKIGPVTEGSFPHKCLNAAVATYHAQIAAAENSRLRELAFPMYQEALQWLGNSGLCYADRKVPPMELAFTLSGAVGGLSDKKILPTTRWFVDDTEYLTYVAEKTTQFQSMAYGDREIYKEENYLYAPETEMPDTVGLLTQGCNVFTA